MTQRRNSGQDIRSTPMVLTGAILLGIGLGALWLVALAAGALGWLTWLDLVAMVSAFGVAMVAGSTDESPRPSAGRAAGVAAGLLSISLLVLWIVGLTTDALPWLAWWNFLLGAGFLLVALSAIAEAPSPKDRTGSGPFRGYGPQPLRTDERLFEDLCDRIAFHPELDASWLDVEVTAGRVRLSGTVRTRGERCLAVGLAESVNGVHRVTSQIAVRRLAPPTLARGAAPRSPTRRIAKRTASAPGPRDRAA